MLAFILRRAIQAIAVMIVVGCVSFAMFRFAGDPISQMVSIDTSAAQRAQMRQSLGLDSRHPQGSGRRFVRFSRLRLQLLQAELMDARRVRSAVGNEGE